MAKGKEIERQNAYKLADVVEAGEPIDFEVYRGVATFEWPDC